MARARATLRLVLALSLALLALGGSLASAQRPGSSQSDEAGEYVSELTDLEVTFSDDWELDDSEVLDDAPMQENVFLLSDAASLTLSFNEATDDDPEDFLAGFIDGISADSESFEVIDEDASRGFAWAVAEAEIDDGTPVIVYIDVDDSFSDDFVVLTMLYAEEGDFLDQYELANETVEIDGDEILGEFDVDELDEIVSGGGTTAGGDDETEDEVDEESTPDADGNDRETGDDGSGSRNSGGDSHTFEIVDLELTVSGDVEINDVQFEEDAYEQVLLLGFGSIGAVSVLDSPLDAEETLSSFMGGFMSEMEDSQEIDSGVDGDVAWTVYEATIGRSEMYVYAIVDEGRVDGLHYLELIAAPIDSFEDEFLAFQDSVEIDGDPMFAEVDIDDLMEIIG